MARINAFKPSIFSTTQTSDLSRLIAPPYDVIKPKQLQALKEQHSNNITHVTLPSGSGDERYVNAGRILKDWIERGTLSQRPNAALFPYSQTFLHPETNAEITRMGLVTALQIEPFDAGIVLPHERTLSGPREDRLKLMEATHANLESIFGMFPDQNKVVLEQLWELTTHSTQLLSATDQLGIHHQVWEITAENVIDQFATLLAPLPVYIVDGHHRYETALNYRDAWRNQHPETAEHHPVDSIMIYLTPMSDPGLVILPTHRIVHSLDHFDFNVFLEELSKNFFFTPCNSPEEGFDRLTENNKGLSLLLANKDQTILITLKDGLRPEMLIDEDLPPAIAELDVSVLHDYVFEKLLGISRASQEAQQNLKYAKSRADALAALHDENNQLVVGMNPTRFDQVEAVAHSGGVMPQKSTYFYPKLASGLLINVLD